MLPKVNSAPLPFMPKNKKATSSCKTTAQPSPSDKSKSETGKSPSPKNHNQTKSHTPGSELQATWRAIRREMRGLFVLILLTVLLGLPAKAQAIDAMMH